MSFREFGNISKKNILYTNENSIDNSKVNNERSSIKKSSNNLNKNDENIFLKKIEKIINKKGQMTTQNKSKRKISNYSVNNSFINFQKNFGNKFYNIININDKTFTTKLNNLSKLKEGHLNNNHLDYLKIKPNNNKNLKIDCGYYYSNRDKYNISGDKFIKKKKAYIYSLPCSTGKNINISKNAKKEKDIISGTSSKRTYAGVNSSLVSKYKYKIKPYIRSSLYKNKEKNSNIYQKISKTKIRSKRTADNSSCNLVIPNTFRRGINESILDKTSSNYRYNSELNSFDVEINKEIEKNSSKISSLIKQKEKEKEKEKEKGKEKEKEKEKDTFKDKISIKNRFKSIKVNKNNCLEKGSKKTLTSINTNGNNNNTNNYTNTNTNSNNTNKNIIINNNINSKLKKAIKNKTRLQSCKFTNEQIYKLKKEIILGNNHLKFNKKKLSKKIYKKNDSNKYNQSNSTKERKNITFYNNYIKNNNLHNNNNHIVNMKHKHYYTNSNVSSFYINNNSAIIRNNHSNLNSKNLNSTNKKRKKSLINKYPAIKESDFLHKIKIKLKSKPVTTIHSKDNSKINILCDDILNNSAKNSKQTYAGNNTNINSKIIHNTKKIFINNIINLNPNNDSTANNECCSYRAVGTEKIQSCKHQILNIPSRTPCLDYSYTNKSRKHILQSHIIKAKPPIKEIIQSKNQNQNKKESSNNPNKCIIKKSNVIKSQKPNNKKIKINKDLIKKEINLINNKKDSSKYLILNSDNTKNLSNIIKNLNNQINKENETIETNPSLVSTLKECTYYKKEMEKLSSYIISYYQKHKEYPNTEQNFYKYGRILGKGAFGKVNLALHLASGRLVAIKSFNKKKLTTKRAKRKIKTEIEALSKLRNPFCTQIYDFFETETHILIVMEYVCGDLLGFIRKRAKISEPTAKIIFKQIIKGLQYIHKKKIVHRDIKLDNVLIDLTNTVKICDFGVCRILHPGDIMYEHCGTPAYIAPEIFKDEGYEGFSCDIWSAGVTLYYMLAGIQPFKANKIEDLKEIIIKGEYDPIEGVSKEANDLINGMLQLNPNKRFTIEEILKHPWLKNVNIKKRESLNIFTNAEKGLLSKYDVNYLSSPKEELIEAFTISNLETKEEKEEKGGTKSDILAPYNSYALNPESDFYPELKIENEICRFNFRAQLSNIKYELSNNQEFDNGIIKTMYNSVEEGNKKNYDDLEPESMNSLNLSLDSIETFTCGLCDDIIKDISEYIGYDKKYLVQCLRKNEINYATATYYLMLRDETNINY